MTLRNILLAGTALGAAVIMTGPAFAGSPAATQAQIDALKQQMQELQQKLDDMQIQTSDALTDIRNTVTMPNGHPTFKSADGNFEASIGGRLQMDAAYINTDDSSQIGESRTTAEIRRARMNVAGKLWDWKYKFEMDFAGNGAAVKDAILSHDFFVYGATIAVGNQFEPFGLDNITSDNNNTFIEYSLPVKLRTDRNLGVVLSYTNATTFGMAAGVFSDNKISQPGNGKSTDWSVSGRGWFTPINDGTTVLHLGVDGRYQTYKGSLTTTNASGGAAGGISAIPEANLAGKSLNTGAISNISNDYRYGPEIAFQYGPFEAQGEYTWMKIQRQSGYDDMEFKGGYVEASYFFKGMRHYDVKGGVFGRPDVDPGAIQLAARYSTLDLSDAYGRVLVANNEIGKENDITIGANYYFNPNVRWMLNYVNAKMDYTSQPDSTANIVETRLQLDW